MRAFLLLLILIALLLPTSGCRRDDSPAQDAGAQVVVTTIAPIGMVLQQIVGDRAEVRVLLSAGASPHTYEPLPSDAAAAARSVLFVSVGRNLDDWAAKLQAPRRLVLMESLPKEYALEFQEGDDHDHHHHDHDHAHDHDHSHMGTDPHFWLDPLAVRAVVPAMVRALSEADPAGAAVYAQNGERLAQELGALHDELASTLQPVTGRAVILFHPSFCYMLNRYGLVYAGSVEMSPGREPTPRYIQELAARVKKHNIPMLFSEPQLSPRSVRVIADAVKVPVGELDPNGGTGEKTTYAALLRHNARTLASMGVVAYDPTNGTISE